MTFRHSVPLASFLGLLVVACGEPTRDEYIVDIVAAYCNRIESCGTFGPGQTYVNYDDCVSQSDDAMRNTWPENACNNGQINETAYDSCFERVEAWSCTATGVDFLAFLADCGRAQVCTDPEDT